MDVKQITCADKLSNLPSVFQDDQTLGEELWSRFHRGKEAQRWYYRALADAMRPLEREWEMVEEYRQLRRRIFP